MAASKTGTIFILLAYATTGDCEIYKWTDKNGKTHYSDSAQEKSKNDVAEKIRLDNVTVSDEQQRAAQERANKDKALAQKVQSKKPPQQASSSKPEPTNDVSRKSCKEQWDLYDKSWACFNPYRIAGGGIKPEASQHCVTIPRPACPAPSNQ